MKKVDLYWKTNHDWWEYDDNLIPIMKESAPPEAKASYQRYLKQVNDSEAL